MYMKEKIFVSDLVEGSFITSVFLVADKTLRTTKSGNPFLALDLADKSGNIDSKVWDNAEAIGSRFEADDFVMVEAQVESYRGQLQLNVRDLKRMDDDDVALEDFIPASRWDRDEMLEQLKDVVGREIKSPEMLRFFDALFEEKQLMKQFTLAPAAKGNHHAYLGGLLEHALSMTRLAVRMTRHYAHYYPGMLNQDLVIAGCVLHDIGKCFELSYGRSFNYTTEGQLVGHIVQGVELITAIAKKVSPPLPAEMLMQLKHLVLSHHGKLEYGSPILPRTAEALLLHEIDMIDSRMNMYSNMVAEHEGGTNSEEAFTDYQRLFQGRMYMGDDTGTKWAKTTTPNEDDLEGPGAAAVLEAEGTPKGERRQPASAGESDPNLSLFSE
ncbi:HD domain-containing protein [Persicimonas caeni]|uniref:HD domain-containing protein n=2 Tax=Persicimonas caeni TaxID=2292766 RepID=A0A4Y6PLY1_PERCE|nr:HD domain-containing protein [Persicimonas caeni]QED30444.1 HD domain-containing protein [Persicimonas caeni]